jgi:hypothetical protein
VAARVVESGGSFTLGGAARPVTAALFAAARVYTAAGLPLASFDALLALADAEPAPPMLVTLPREGAAGRRQ